MSGRLAIARFLLLGLAGTLAPMVQETDDGGSGFFHRPARSEGEATMRRFIVALKAFAVMIVAGFGGGAIGAGIKVSRDGSEVGAGTFLLVGAFFLYRMWFGRKDGPARGHATD